ncbi:MAG: hypothetical protein EON59_06235 [Alphaproteobacteria bacterium]|nr:MAG: hypothetical protein EON59_06235 [Alphaproteobacteria bacterium]
MTPNERITAFVDGLPHTIRDNVWAIILIYLGGEITSKTDVTADARKALNSERHERVRVAVVAAAALDFHLSRPRIENTNWLVEVAEREGAEDLMRMGLQEPLKDRHFDKALDDWSELRGGPLSLEGLHRYQAQQMANSPLLRGPQ